MKLKLLFYVFEKISPNYILLGKFRTDYLETPFGQYRQMSGGNHNISWVQVLEVGRKLKIFRLINVYSQQNGKFQISIQLLLIVENSVFPLSL